MRMLLMAAAGLAILGAGGCTSLGESSSGSRGSENIGGFVRSTDTYGTGRRVDVYGGSTAPVLPTIGAPGYGK